MAGKLDFELGFGQSSGARQRQPESPLKILYIGNYGADTKQTPFPERRTQPLDIDGFDALIARIHPTLTQFGLTFESVEDFHPDQLLQTEWFASQVDLRARLSNPSTFAEAASELRELLGTDPAASTGEDSNQTDSAPEDESNPFARLLNEDTAPISRGSSDPLRSRIDELLKEAVAPYVQPDADPDQAALLEAVEELLSTRLFEVLHDPAFQSLEASWRWLEETVRRVETSAALQLAVLPVSLEELTVDAAELDGDITRSRLYDTMITRGIDAVGEAPWTYVVADYHFHSSDEDMRLLAYLAALANEAGAQLITGAAPELAGCTRIGDLNAPERWHSADDAGMSSWQTLRRSSLAQGIFATLPRVLTRYPYSKKLNPVAAFDFDELSSGAPGCLWGNAAYGCAIALGLAFTEYGWDMEIATHAPIQDLPTWQIDRDGAAVAQPTTEVSLGETAAAALIGRGFTPICHVHGTNEARIPGLHAAS